MRIGGRSQVSVQPLWYAYAPFADGAWDTKREGHISTSQTPSPLFPRRNNSKSTVMSKQPGAFKVIIVGGGVAGLTLSLTLAAAEIDYILLEAHQEFAPHSGASIAVFPNGAKTLDQLGGVLDDLYRVSSPLADGYARDDIGKVMYYINMIRYQDRY